MQISIITPIITIVPPGFKSTIYEIYSPKTVDVTAKITEKITVCL